MNSHSIDAARTRLSRRHALEGAAAGFAAVALSGASIARSHEATPTADKVSLLFVQSFSECTIVPTADDPNSLILTLVHDSGQTLYFAERPSRIVGFMETAGFVDSFRADNAADPANAALVGLRDGKDAVTHVVELIDLQYDAVNRTARYTVRLLSDMTKSGFGFRDEPEQTIGESRRYGPSQLFIDAGGLMQLVAYGAQDIYLDGD